MNLLTPVIQVNKEKCVSCHQCIAVCPVKFCNEAQSSAINVNENLCIGCGACIKACTHDARHGLDDTNRFFEDLAKGFSIIAVVAPAVAAVFPEQYLQLNSWLRSIGVKACFDVSFGAELTVKSYLEHIKEHKPKAVIAQPCPALVTFIEIYHPELLPFLAPVDSPMMHTMKMIRTFYPDYKDTRFAVISPCYAKRREFDEVGIGEYNVTMVTLKKYLSEHSIDLNRYEKSDFDNPPAERAVLFSTPGGLLRTALRWIPGLTHLSRKIEGPHLIYEYLESLHKQIEKGYAPLLIDCLNCDLGCNGGPGTDNQGKSPDEIEHHIERRSTEMKNRWSASGKKNDASIQKKVNKLLQKFWRKDLYIRTYTNRQHNNRLVFPSPEEKKAILASMYKFTQTDHYNCSSCGYNKCENMAFAIHNNINRPEHCHYYSQKKIEQLNETTKKVSEKQQQAVSRISQSLKNISNSINSIVMSTEQIQLSNNDISHTSQNASQLASNSASMASNTINIIEILERTTLEVKKSLDGIDTINDQTKLLSLNAAIEAVNAGDAGKSFGVVANEIKLLAAQTAKTSELIFQHIEKMNQQTATTVENIRLVDGSINQINSMQATVAAAVDEQSSTITGITGSMKNVADEIQTISNNLIEVINVYDTVNFKN